MLVGPIFRRRKPDQTRSRGAVQLKQLGEFLRRAAAKNGDMHVFAVPYKRADAVAASGSIKLIPSSGNCLFRGP
jgi:hypothetical protein